uniref:Major facilitator superfamily (MFS) profile domain-containing protein n=1 Tax=Alexandrium monilatum TaxID=311494 RepID=A0A7S4UQZ7_9DINO
MTASSRWNTHRTLFHMERHGRRWALMLLHASAALCLVGEAQAQEGYDEAELVTMFLQASLRFSSAHSQAGANMTDATAAIGQDPGSPQPQLLGQDSRRLTANLSLPQAAAQDLSSDQYAPAANHSHRLLSAAPLAVADSHGYAWSAPVASHLQEPLSLASMQAPEKLGQTPLRYEDVPGICCKGLVVLSFGALLAVGGVLVCMGPDYFVDKQNVMGKAFIDRRSVLHLVMFLSAWEVMCTEQFLPNIPEIETQLGGSYAQMSFSVLETTLMKGVVSFIIGMFSDHTGRRRTILFLAFLHPVSILACGWAPDVGWFMAARVLQGVAEGTAVVVPGVVRDIFPDPEERADALAQLLIVTVLGPLIAPFGGAVLGLWLGWRAVFMILVPGMVVCWFLLYFYLPETLAVNPKISERYWKEVRWMLGSRSLMSLLATLSIASAIVFLMLSNIPLILRQDFDASPMITAVFLGIFAAAVVPGFVLSTFGCQQWGVAAMLRTGSFLLLVPLALFLACGIHFPHSAWMLVAAQFSYSLLSSPLFISADVLYMEPLEDVYATAEALKTAALLVAGPLIVALPGMLVVIGPNHAQAYCLFAAGAIFATMAAAWFSLAAGPESAPDLAAGPEPAPHIREKKSESITPGWGAGRGSGASTGRAFEAGEGPASRLLRGRW